MIHKTTVFDEYVVELPPPYLGAIYSTRVLDTNEQVHHSKMTTTTLNYGIS